MKTTEYRKISNGYWEYLQYKETHRLWGFLWNTSKWEYIEKPYYDQWWGRSVVIYPDAKVCINSLYDNLDGFVKNYPCIDEYFKLLSERNKELKEKVLKEKQQIENKRGKIVYYKN